MALLEVDCSGSPYEIGVQHGQAASLHIGRAIKFYAGLFQASAKLDWVGVCEKAVEFAPSIQRKFPAFGEEMRGIADGAGVTYADILALNVRTEITFGLFSDGCTAVSWKTDKKSFLAQNWDWMEQQKENLIVVNIHQEGKPRISMMTEAGLIGKIGLNSAGVGVCLNAIRVKGMDPTHLPVHLGLRVVLESTSKEEAISQLEKYGIASSAHMLIADPNGAVGLECTAIGFAKLPMDSDGKIVHTNHLLAKHPGVEDTMFWKDSFNRIDRIQGLMKTLPNNPEDSDIYELFKDENNFPASICRAQAGDSRAATLFNIAMDLTSKMATVTMGRPIAPEETIILAP
ncbi:acyl-CoA 6-aminopenicillanic-acid-acyltransferase [Gloeophyllum trabeum ATCC 11539]|uniref:Acyl-CoA 6-aminopenicillanic-acid-acyltransferase n=1 Tax=Gloeophyllum trabeum (strain ATCC 11539 / FP-39264 / Madison 617) TaxID=670483 RepID=S7PUZ4_GLOTA|nr:acyl-CoA 6-aminopenicillanic-acid-acyltransferase [Gloeophyllum trabeum ATCC 11539]EPQ51268.1 acyl-CoA 6-aminopenicillanic-acid-acyltransferase [Gloeophyllum trabeum ATCC 11539]